MSAPLTSSLFGSLREFPLSIIHHGILSLVQTDRYFMKKGVRGMFELIHLCPSEVSGF